ncbi:MAG: helix-turn-helix domain-containing protein [Bacteroidaceae bacterium]|nr:helix-turn-helix domain-containing protein [Bacteroidaceae bacterium]
MNKFRGLRGMVVAPMLMMLCSIVSGWHCYDRAKAEMTEDLNHALESTPVSDAGVRSVLDSLSTFYADQMLTFGGRHKGFADRLSIASLRDTAHISYSLTRNGSSGRNGETGGARICSDTIVLAERTVDGADVILEVRAYANPSVASIFAYSATEWPLCSFAFGMSVLIFLFVSWHRMPTSGVSLAVESAEEPGSVLISSARGMELTPMQEQLIQLFCNSPTHTLSKEEICSALWPKKENPDDSLYTFISRTKASLARQSTLRIVNRRGREYILVDENDVKCSN